MKKVLALVVMVIILSGCSLFQKPSSGTTFDGDHCDKLIALEKEKSVKETQIIFYVYMKSEGIDYDVKKINDMLNDPELVDEMYEEVTK